MAVVASWSIDDCDRSHRSQPSTDGSGCIVIAIIDRSLRCCIVIAAIDRWLRSQPWIVAIDRWIAAMDRSHQLMAVVASSIAAIDRWLRSQRSIDECDHSHGSQPSIDCNRSHGSQPSIDGSQPWIAAIDRWQWLHPHRSQPSIDDCDHSHRSQPSIDGSCCNWRSQSSWSQRSIDDWIASIDWWQPSINDCHRRHWMMIVAIATIDWFLLSIGQPDDIQSIAEGSLIVGYPIDGKHGQLVDWLVDWVQAGCHISLTFVGEHFLEMETLRSKNIKWCGST